AGMPDNQAGRPVGGKLPQPDGPILAGGDDPWRGGTETHRGNITGVVQGWGNRGPACDVPKSCRPIPTRRRQHMAVRTKDARTDSALMKQGRSYGTAGFGFKDTDHAVPAGCGKTATIRAKTTVEQISTWFYRRPKLGARLKVTKIN